MGGYGTKGMAWLQEELHAGLWEALAEKVGQANTAQAHTCVSRGKPQRGAQGSVQV